jgi:hypothetical protein
VRVDEPLIEPAMLDHDLQHAGKERRVAAGLHRQEQIAGARHRRQARILDDDPRAVLARLPQVIRRNRRHSATFEPATQFTSVPIMSAHGLVTRSMPNGFLVRRPGAHHAEPAVVIDVRRLQADARELPSR